MTLDTSLPPPLFDLDEQAEASGRSPQGAPFPRLPRRPGHQLVVHTAWPSGQFIACTACAEQSPHQIARKPDELTRWAYEHLGVEYDSEIARKIRPTCGLTWVEADPALPHDEHACVFHRPGPHTRHECRCGLNLHTEAAAL